MKSWSDDATVRHGLFTKWHHMAEQWQWLFMTVGFKNVILMRSSLPCLFGSVPRLPLGRCGIKIKVKGCNRLILLLHKNVPVLKLLPMLFFIYQKAGWICFACSYLKGCVDCLLAFSVFQTCPQILTNYRLLKSRQSFSWSFGTIRCAMQFCLKHASVRFYNQ